MNYQTVPSQITLNDATVLLETSSVSRVDISKYTYNVCCVTTSLNDMEQHAILCDS